MVTLLSGSDQETGQPIDLFRQPRNPGQDKGNEDETKQDMYTEIIPPPAGEMWQAVQRVKPCFAKYSGLDCAGLENIRINSRGVKTIPFGMHRTLALTLLKLNP